MVGIKYQHFLILYSLRWWKRIIDQKDRTSRIVDTSKDTNYIFSTIIELRNKQKIIRLFKRILMPNARKYKTSQHKCVSTYIDTKKSNYPNWIKRALNVQHEKLNCILYVSMNTQIVGELLRYENDQLVNHNEVGGATCKHFAKITQPNR